MNILSLLGFGKKTEKIKEMLRNGALVVDVRSPQEYATGHVKPSVNVPLDSLSGKVKKLKKTGKPLVVCCASGMRSGVASGKLKAEGIDCINGGSWSKVDKLMDQIKNDR